MTSREFKTRLGRRGRRAGVALSEDLASGLWSYFELLSRWNSKINLTSLDERAPDATIDRLLIEPLLAARYLPSPKSAVIDIGSGGGSPAIPLKLAAPSASLVMVEAKARKSAFLREAVRHLGLTRTQVENARYQELLARPDLHESMGVLTVRAVRIEPKVLVSLQAFLKPTGLMFLFRSGARDDMPDAIPPPLRWEASYPLTSDGPNSRLVVLAKRLVGDVSRGTTH